jgi:hypothetical protein
MTLGQPDDETGEGQRGRERPMLRFPDPYPTPASKPEREPECEPECGPKPDGDQSHGQRFTDPFSNPPGLTKKPFAWGVE